MSSLASVTAAQSALQSHQQIHEQPIINRSNSTRLQPSYLSQAASAIARNSTGIAMASLAIYAASNAPVANADLCATCLASCVFTPNPPACIGGCMATYCAAHVSAALAALAAYAGGR